MMQEGSFVQWNRRRTISDTKGHTLTVRLVRYGIINRINKNFTEFFVLDKADENTRYYNESGIMNKDNVKIESNRMPDDLKKYGGEYGVYSKTYSGGIEAIANK